MKYYQKRIALWTEQGTAIAPRATDPEQSKGSDLIKNNRSKRKEKATEQEKATGHKQRTVPYRTFLTKELIVVWLLRHGSSKLLPSSSRWRGEGDAEESPGRRFAREYYHTPETGSAMEQHTRFNRKIILREECSQSSTKELFNQKNLMQRERQCPH